MLYLSVISLKENYFLSLYNFRSLITSLIRAIVIELLCVEVCESRRAMVFGGAQGRSGHKPDGHVSAGSKRATTHRRPKSLQLQSSRRSHMESSDWRVDRSVVAATTEQRFKPARALAARAPD